MFVNNAGHGISPEVTGPPASVSAHKQRGYFRSLRRGKWGLLRGRTPRNDGIEDEPVFLVTIRRNDTRGVDSRRSPYSNASPINTFDDKSVE